MNWMGDRIKDRAKEVGLSVQALALGVGVSRQTIALWVQGKIPRGEHLFKLCNLLKVELNYFMAVEEELVSIPQHRTSTGKPLTKKMRDDSQELAEQYINVFRNTSLAKVDRVIRVSKRADDEAKKIAFELRQISGVESNKPFDFKDVLKLVHNLGIYTIFRIFPDSINKNRSAFYCKIYGQRVIFINGNMNYIDLIFYLLHETVHAIRDEKPSSVDEKEEERFCDKVAGYVQFPESYLVEIEKVIKQFNIETEEKRIISYLRGKANDNHHSIYGLYQNLISTGKMKEINSVKSICAWDANLRKNYPTVNEILFDKEDAHKYVKMLSELSPLFVQLVSEKADEVTLRKVCEWLGLQSSIDAKKVVDELKRQQV